MIVNPNPRRASRLTRKPRRLGFVRRLIPAPKEEKTT